MHSDQTNDDKCPKHSRIIFPCLHKDDKKAYRGSGHDGPWVLNLVRRGSEDEKNEDGGSLLDGWLEVLEGLQDC